MKGYHNIRIVSILFIFLIGFNLHATDILTYINAQEEVKLLDMIELSDSSMLVTGETTGNLDWIGTEPAVLDVSETNFFQEKQSSPMSLDMLGSDDLDGFIIHISSDFTSIISVVKFPDGMVENIQKVRTTNVPGEATAEMFISGKARSASDTSVKGYFIAKLNANFVDQTPSVCEWFRFVDAPNVDNFSQCFNLTESQHRQKQPWDVDANGRVVYVLQREFSHGRWVKLERLNSEGELGVMDSAFYQIYHTHYDSLPHNGIEETHVVSNSQIYYPVSVGDSVEARLRFVDENGQDSMAWTTVVVDSLKSSFYQFKISSGRSLRSLKKEELDSVNKDENKEDRHGLMPMDLLFSKDFNTGNDQGGFWGHNNAVGNMVTALIGDIQIDKRTNHIYFGVTYAVNDNNWMNYTYPDFSCPNMMGIHFESAVVALEENGLIKWWGRGYNIKGIANSDSEASQFVDKLAIDYENNRLAVLQRSYGYSDMGNNFFHGDQLAANPGGNGFQNQWTGDVKKTEVSWLGIYELDSLLITNATYIGEYSRTAVPEGSPLDDQNLNNWANPNEGDADLGPTVCYDMKVNTNGEVIVACTGERVITTANAYQSMIPPDQDEIMDSIPPESSAFVRKYASDLSSVLYSSILTGDWDIQTGEGGDNTKITSVWPLDDRILVSGWYSGEGEKLRATQPHAWGDSEVNGVSGFFAELSMLPKIMIQSYPEVVGFDTDYQVAFDVPESITFDMENVFTLELSVDGAFEENQELGSIQGTGEGSVLMNIPGGLIDNGAYYIRITSDNPKLYSNVVKVYVPSLFCSDLMDLTFVQTESVVCRETIVEYEVNNVCGVYEWSIIPPQAGSIVSSRRDSHIVEIRWNDFIGDVALYVSANGADSSGVLQTRDSDTLNLFVSGFDSYLVADSSEKTITAFPNNIAGGYEYEWRILSGYIPAGSWTLDSTFNPMEEDGGVTVRVKDLLTGCVEAATDTIDLYAGEGNSIYIVSQSSDQILFVYPNPADDVLYLNISQDLLVNEKSVQIKIVDLLGRVIYNNQIQKDALMRTYAISLNQADTGTYLLLVTIDGVHYTLHFVIK